MLQITVKKLFNMLIIIFVPKEFSIIFDLNLQVLINVETMNYLVYQNS